MTTYVDQDVAVQSAPAGRYSLRWGPIAGGMLASFGLFVLLSMLAVAIGAALATDGTTAPPLVMTVIAAAIALFSFFMGGLIAAWSGDVVGDMRGALYGFLVWAFWLVLVLFAGGLGLGQLFGALGGTLADITAPDLTRDQVNEALRTGAFRTFLALGLAAAAATLGGVVGARDDIRERWVRRVDRRPVVTDDMEGRTAVRG
jgi:hypothetical protein